MFVESVPRARHGDLTTMSRKSGALPFDSRWLLDGRSGQALRLPLAPRRSLRAGPSTPVGSSTVAQGRRLAIRTPASAGRGPTCGSVIRAARRLAHLLHCVIDGEGVRLLHHWEL